MTDEELPRPRWFKGLRGKQRHISIVAFDIEGSGVAGGFVCGSIASGDQDWFYTDPKQMFQHLLEFGAEGAWIFSHNLQYDLPVLEGDNFPSGRLLFTRYNILFAEYLHWGRKVKIYDSANLYPRHSVASMGRVVNSPKLEANKTLLHHLSQGRPYGHFTEQEQAHIRSYVTQDARIVYLAVEKLQEIILELGGNLHSTLAGCSMDIYRRRYHKYPWMVLGPETNSLARPAYYGGRTENFAVGMVPNVNMYDITSLYPSVQGMTRFPLPSRLSLQLNPKLFGEWLNWEGVAACRMVVPEFFVPPLPHRFAGRLFFPYGDIRGQWTIQEIRQAVMGGCQLLGVDWVLGSKTHFNPFHEFVETLFAKRLGYLQANDTTANIVKLLLNSLYGRWGLNPAGGLYQLVDIDKPDPDGDLTGYVTHMINGHIYAYGPMRGTRQPDYVNVLFAAQIASAARLELLDELRGQSSALVYCDTDSIITQGEIETGEGLGKWRMEMQDGSADIAGPKEYALHNQALGDRYVVKGVPADVQKSYFETGVARYFRALSIREAMATGQRPSTWVETIHSHQEIVPKRWPMRPLSNPLGDWVATRPYSLSELGEISAGSERSRLFHLDGLDQILPVEPLPVQADFLSRLALKQKTSRGGISFRRPS